MILLLSVLILKIFAGNKLLLPSGPLRESLKNLKKYDAVILNGYGENTLNIINDIKQINPSIKIFEAKYVPVNLGKFNKEHNYLVFSGIGNPNTFKKTLIVNNFTINDFLIFSDHYNYKYADIQKIKIRAKELNAKILTTEKDYMRINKSYIDDINFIKD